MDFRQQKRTAQGNAARNKTQTKTLGRKKRHKTQNLADERRITGRFAKRFSGERPVSLGFELSFYPSLSELFGGCLTATRSVALVYVKHPPKCHLKFLRNSTSVNPIAVEKFRNLCYNVEKYEVRQNEIRRSYFQNPVRI